MIEHLKFEQKLLFKIAQTIFQVVTFNHEKVQDFIIIKAIDVVNMVKVTIPNHCFSPLTSSLKISLMIPSSSAARKASWNCSFCNNMF